MPHTVIPDLIRNPGTVQENLRIPAFAGMTIDAVFPAWFIATAKAENMTVPAASVPSVAAMVLALPEQAAEKVFCLLCGQAPRMSLRAGGETIPFHG
jgi:hypothetical protein